MHYNKIMLSQYEVPSYSNIYFNNLDKFLNKLSILLYYIIQFVYTNGLIIINKLLSILYSYFKNYKPNFNLELVLFIIFLNSILYRIYVNYINYKQLKFKINNLENQLHKCKNVINHNHYKIQEENNKKFLLFTKEIKKLKKEINMYN